MRDDVINRTKNFLGILAGAMALVSLIFGAFQEPLAPYLQGVMGGVLKSYQTMRDVLFDGIGWGLTTLLNLLRNWFTWLPEPPWLSWRPEYSDNIVFWSLYFSASYRMVYDPWGQRVAAETMFAKRKHKSLIRSAFSFKTAFDLIRLFATIFWFALPFIVGAFIFFLIAYGTSRLGV